MVQYFLSLLSYILVAGWVNIYDGLHSPKTIFCQQPNCIYGFRTSTDQPALYLNCTTNPLTAVYLQNDQQMIIQNCFRFSPAEQYYLQLITFDIYFTSQWVDDKLLFEYNSQLISEINYSTKNPLTFNYGLCDALEYDVTTFFFILPKQLNPQPLPKFAIINQSIKAMIRNVHVSYQVCFQTCYLCSGPLSNQCLSCKGGMQIINGECRCPIRKSFNFNIGQCIDKCMVISNSKSKIQNRICVDFARNYILSANLAYSYQAFIALWNVIYDPMHIDTSAKKGANNYLGIFKFREGAYVSINTQYEPYPLTVAVQLYFCNQTPVNSGVQFLINQVKYASLNYDGFNYQLDNIYLRGQQTLSGTALCTTYKQMNLEMYFQFYEKQQLVFSITGNFTQAGSGWLVQDVEIGNGNCPQFCLKCDQFYKCAQCANNFLRFQDGTCGSYSCPTDAPWNGTHCVRYYQRTKYTNYLVKEFYDFVVTDTMNSVFNLESSTPQDIQKGENIFWSYESTQRVFGGKYVWAEARFSQTYNLNPHHSITIGFSVGFGAQFPNSPSNYLQYEINSGTLKKVLYTSNKNIIEEINSYNPQFKIALQCFGGNVVNQYCLIYNYYILIHYCRPYCLQCTNEFDCQLWDSYDPNAVKLFQSDCSSNQFLDKETFTCEACPDECLTCFNEYECLSCQTNYHLYKTTCLLDCLVNQYYDGIICQDCLYSCKQCSKFSDCIHCEVTNLRYLLFGHCICYDGYYDQLNTPLCQPCNILCQTCNGPTNNDCLSCASFINVIQIGQICQCQDGYYFDQNQIKCQLCHTQCQTCFGNSNSNCLSCSLNQFRSLQGFQCQCQSGYYELNLQNQCQQCPSVINNSLLQCFKDCGDGIKKWFNQVCSPISCLIGFENIDNACIPKCGDNLTKGNEECDDGNVIQYDGCHNCRFQCPIQCTTCNSATTFPCPDICGDGYTTGDEECDDGNYIQYDGCFQCKLECQIQCTKCLRGLCSECQTFGWVLDPSTRLCKENCGDQNIVGKEQCDEGYNFDPNDGCFNCKFQCRNDCLTCSADGKTCLECKTIGFKPQNYYCVNICGDGYLAVDPFNRYFEQCDDFNGQNDDGCSWACLFQCQPTSICTVCVNNKCQSCVSTYYLDTSKNKCIEFCNDTQIVGNEKCEDMNNQMNDGCYNCQLSCQSSCQNCNVNGCQTCKSGYQLINKNCKSICGDKIIVSEEDCDDGNLIPFDGCHQCKYFCDSTCKVCLKGKCLECENGFRKVQFKCIQIQKIKHPIEIKKTESNTIFSCQALFESTCLQCRDNFNLDVYNNRCVYQQQKLNQNININNNYDKLTDMFESKELNCKYYANNYGCLECLSNFDFDSINNTCNYRLEKQFLSLKIINVYDKAFNIIFKQKELNCQLSIKDHQYECLECINNFSLDWMTKECHSGCGDEIVNGLEQCEDSNQLQFDGCYDCQYQCCEYCQICKFAKCKKCMENYFLASDTKCEIKLVCNELGFYYDELKNECYNICGDGIISKNEDCDDANNIPYDGCYKCQFSCPKMCYVCEKGECLIEQPKPCEEGYYYYFDTKECEPICGDGIQVLPFEECDDGNDQNDDECDNCLLQCNKYCKVCEFQNKCSFCKDNYELVNKTCLESQNNQCQIENCQECNYDLCIACQQGFILLYGICQSICGDGILVGTEQCDDGNLINGDGCGEDCLPTKNSICKNQECVIINPPLAKLIYLYERQGEQFVMLQYNQKMRVSDGHSVEDYLSSLNFQFQGEQSNVSEFTILDFSSDENKNKEITIKIKFLQRLDTPKLILNITDTSLLINENSIPIEENIYILTLLQSNILSQQEQESVESFVHFSEQNLKILAALVALASITGKLEIVENILDTIQQLIGANLGQFYETFKIIQLANILDYMSINIGNKMDSYFRYFNSEQVFEYDNRNANFIPNLIQLFPLFFAFTLSFYVFKFISKYLLIFTQTLKTKQSSKMKLYFVNQIANNSIKIQQTKYWFNFQNIFSTIIYEYGISTMLAIKYSKHNLEGILGFCVSILILYTILFKFIMMVNQRLHFGRRGTDIQKENNRYVYLCIQRFYFTIALIFFYHSVIIQIFMNLLNEIVICYSIFQFKIFGTKAENLKQLIHHSVLFLINLAYIGNELFKNNIEILILLAWIIIMLMSLTLVQTTIIDLIMLLYPIAEKITESLKLKQFKTSNQILTSINCNQQKIIRQIV